MRFDMSKHCGYCRGPISGQGLRGRPWPDDTAPAVYCCYGCLNLGEQHRQECQTADLSLGRASSSAVSWQGVRLGLAAVIAGQSMIFSLAINMHPEAGESVRFAVHGVILAFTVLVFALLGGPLVSAAWRELRGGRITLEALFLVTMLGSMVASLQAHFVGTGSIYYEVISILLVVYTLGKLLGSRGRAAAIALSENWLQRLSLCRVRHPISGQVRECPVSEIQPGDWVAVRPGEAVPVDGMIREGVGFVSEAALNGEPFPVVRRPGDCLHAGAISYDACFLVEATVPGTARQIDRLFSAVEQARDAPLSLQSTADRLGRVLLPAVILTSMGTGIFWSCFTDVGGQTSLFYAMAVLLVACPCVVGLATPLVVWTMIGRLAESGLMIRSGDFVERLATVDCVLIDKTGTLTEEQFSLADVVIVRDWDRAWILSVVSLMQELSSHPIARAFTGLPRSFPSGRVPVIRDFRVVAGQGVEGTVIPEGREPFLLQIGRPDWLAEATRNGWNQVADLEANLLTTSGHILAIAVNTSIVGLAVVSERLRDSASAALSEFQQLGLPVQVLTGDSQDPGEVEPVSARFTGLSAEEKLQHVELQRANGQRPLMIGDGINDAAALAAAHAGIALSSGTDLAISSAPATLYHGDLRAIPWAIVLCRDAMRVARRNLSFAVAYNVVGMSLAATGMLHPIVAAFLMAASSLTLVMASLRVGRDPRHCQLPMPTFAAVSRVRPLGHGSIRAWVHGLAITGQGLVLGEMAGLNLGGLIVVGVLSLLVGAWLAREWQRRPDLSHTLDMTFGMFTLGNLGMVLGWWYDLGFQPAVCAQCCSCAELRADRLGMWIGMVVFANVAMIGLGRRAMPGGSHPWAMFIGGNLGMLLGMAVGGFAVSELISQFEFSSLPWIVSSHYLGMSLGMIAGMLAGTVFLEMLLDAWIVCHQRWWQQIRTRSVNS